MVPAVNVGEILILNTTSRFAAIKVFVYYDLSASGKEGEKRSLFPTVNSYFCLSLGNKQVQFLKHRPVELVNYLKGKTESWRIADYKRLWTFRKKPNQTNKNHTRFSISARSSARVSEQTASTFSKTHKQPEWQ